MTHFKLFTILLTIVSLFACGEAITQETSDESGATAEGGSDAASIEQLFKSSMKEVEATKYLEFIDPKNGLVQARYPIPKSWTVNSTDDPVYIEGPNGLKVYKAETSNYVWSNDPMMQQSLQMGGQTLAQPAGTRQILEQFLKPNAQGQGYRFLKSYELPEVAGFWQRLFHAMPNTGSQRKVEALGTEWESNAGTRSLIVLVQYQSMRQQTLFWGVQTTELETEPGSFEKARNAYLYSLANAQLNPQWIQHMNGQLVGNIRKSNEFWANATAQSAAAHQQRMNAIAARGNAATSVGNTYSDILDISHQGFLNRSHINDAGHASTIRAINETALIGNHETGEHYTVPAGSNYYWVSNDGAYFGTDNALLDPNTDQRMNDKDWTKFAVEQ